MSARPKCRWCECDPCVCLSPYGGPRDRERYDVKARYRRAPRLDELDAIPMDYWTKRGAQR